jgi:anaerobic magnesium-protoporphyrin IX monomethyl ester cyclase
MKRRADTVQLIQMISAERSPYSPVERSSPPLGLLSIATRLKSVCPDISVEILDAAVLDSPEIMRRIGADVVGFSINLWNYQESLRVAELAKNRGATVVLGGHHATSVGSNILKNRPFVDFVIRGDGETAFTELVEGEKPDCIQNLIYRKNGSIVENQVIQEYLLTISFPRRDLIDLSPYFTNYRLGFPDSPFEKFATYYSHKGCTWRAKMKTNACVFCAITDKGWRSRDPKELWKELCYLSKTYGINYAMDVGDNLVKSWLRRFVDSKPPDLEMSFTAYVRANEVDEGYAELLRRGNCYSMFLGVESGDDEVLENSGKGTTPEDNLRAARLLADHGIKVRMGVVLGLPGESVESLETTVEHVRKLVALGNMEGVYTAILIPIPGSPAFRRLINYDRFHDRLVRQDLFDMDELRLYWIRDFTNVSMEIVREFADHIIKLARPICQ